jgi:hypothetical protein
MSSIKVVDASLVRNITHYTEGPEDGGTRKLVARILQNKRTVVF